MYFKLNDRLEIMRNRDFYRLNDIRPPYTYASLIRQVMIVQKSKRAKNVHSQMLSHLKNDLFTGYRGIFTQTIDFK